MNISHLKTKDIKSMRDKLLSINEGLCPVLKTKLDPSKAVLDHIHKQKMTDDITENAGVIRNTIDRNVNSFLGKIENNFKRYIPKDTIKLSDLLRNLADYIDKGAYVENNTIFSHPRENGNGDLIKMKKIVFPKKIFNALNIKLVENKKKPIKYKKYIDNKIQELIEKYLPGAKEE